ncbi:hypothetical protein DH2020_015879 [Rehmannia glutinosa]|uniref:DDE Tnp4 domain-containing protein n=1 Tax=Rehmannia glutinosa TaxID=99300 RepID=A0ABR0WTW1_REHGL
MNFSYVLSGWEGSAADSRVLRDEVTRTNGLNVPNGSYYLCDLGYTNSPGFLAPYHGVRYHLDEWGSGSLAPQNYSTSMAVDPLEDQFPEFIVEPGSANVDQDIVDNVEPSQPWTNWRDNLAMSKYDEWRG